MELLPARVTETDEPPFHLGEGSAVQSPRSVLSDDPVAGVTTAQKRAFRAAMGNAVQAEVVRGWKYRGVTVESWGRAFGVAGLEPGSGDWQQVTAARVDVWCEALGRVDPRQVIRTAGLTNHPALRRK